MGDRRNVIIKADSEEYGIALYTHWTGWRMLEDVSAALDRGRGRWDDPGYFTRIMFDEMCKREPRNEITGFGIYPLRDGESPMESFPGYDPVIDLDERSVTVEGETYSFNKFIAVMSALVPE